MDQEYTVGSLSALISGSKGNIKAKKVKGMPVPVKKEAIAQNGTSPGGKKVKTKKNKSKPVKSELIEQTGDDSAVVFNGKQKKLKSKKMKREATPQTVEENDEPLPVGKKVKTQKLKQKPISVNTIEQNDEPPAVSSGKKVKTKQMKRKAEPEAQPGQSPPKKTKFEENASRRVHTKEKIEKQSIDPDVLARTIFVGNLPVVSKRDKLKKYFAKYGCVESVRIRSVAVANPKTPKKVAVIRNELHPDRKSFTAYVRFEAAAAAQRATDAENGAVYKEHHLRVERCVPGVAQPEDSKGLFIGNLPFGAEDEEIWKLFEVCGEIAWVRLVRDRRTGMGKGFCYVNFKNADSVALAMEMEDVTLNNRVLRIMRCNSQAGKKNKNGDKVKERKPKPFKPRSKPKASEEQEDGNEDAQVKDQAFQGAKFPEKKKKKSLNKGLQQKKRMIKKIAPK